MFETKLYFSWIWNEPNTPLGLFLMKMQQQGLVALKFPKRKGGEDYVNEFIAKFDESETFWKACFEYWNSLPWDHPVRSAFSRRVTPGMRFGVIMPPDWREVGPALPSDELIAEIEDAAGITFKAATVGEVIKAYRS